MLSVTTGATDACSECLQQVFEMDQVGRIYMTKTNFEVRKIASFGTNCLLGERKYRGFYACCCVNNTTH